MVLKVCGSKIFEAFLGSLLFFLIQEVLADMVPINSSIPFKSIEES